MAAGFVFFGDWAYLELMDAWSFIRKFLGGRSSRSDGSKISRPHREPSPLPEDDAKERVTSFASKLVRGGYCSRDEIIESVAYYTRDEGINNVDPVSLVDAEIRKLKHEQASWPPVTDYDRLVIAMQTLEDKDIVARQDFSCCMTCGNSEIIGEMERYNANGRKARGYVYFHQQATEHAIEGHGINFAYGSATENTSDAAAIAIGAELAQSLKSAGLKVDWNGSLERCVMVDLDWKRRWPGD